MNPLSNRKVLLTAVSAGAIGVSALIAACSGSSGGAPGTGDGGSGPNSNPPEADGGAGVNNTTPGSCGSPTLSLVFAPMYSAYIPNSTAQTFQVPAITADGNTADWSSSDPTKVQLAADPTSGGVMITMTGTGDVTIFAAEGSTCGSSTLHITANTEADWSTGNARYNNGVAIHLGPPQKNDGGGGFNPDAGGSFLEQDGGVACTNCHGPTATNGLYNDVSHTPEQTGGFSDQDLIGIIVNGVIPDGGYFDPTVIRASCVDAGTTLGPNMAACGQQAYARWQALHQWNDITADEQAGIVCYLRSLQPQPQNGTANFGGHQGDGGTHHHDGGGFHNDGGGFNNDSGNPQPDATTPGDAASGSDATGD